MVSFSCCSLLVSLVPVFLLPLVMSHCCCQLMLSLSRVAVTCRCTCQWWVYIVVVHVSCCCSLLSAVLCCCSLLSHVLCCCSLLSHVLCCFLLLSHVAVSNCCRVLSLVLIPCLLTCLYSPNAMKHLETAPLICVPFDRSSSNNSRMFSRVERCQGILKNRWHLNARNNAQNVKGDSTNFISFSPISIQIGIVHSITL